MAMQLPNPLHSFSVTTIPRLSNAKNMSQWVKSSMMMMVFFHLTFYMFRQCSTGQTVATDMQRERQTRQDVVSIWTTSSYADDWLTDESKYRLQPPTGRQSNRANWQRCWLFSRLCQNPSFLHIPLFVNISGCEWNLEEEGYQSDNFSFTICRLVNKAL